MTLHIYQESGGTGQISQGGSMTSPLTFSLSRQGGVVDKRLFLRSNSPSTESIVDGTLYAYDGTSPDESSWVTFAEDIAGAAGQFGDTLTFNIDLNGEVPFWIKLNVPQAQEQGIKVDISLVTDYTVVEA